MIDPCKDETFLTALMDDVLSDAEASAVHRHVAHCPQCRQKLAQLKEADAMLRGLPSMEASADFEPAFWRKVAAEQEKRERRSWARYLLSGWRPVLTGGLAAGLVAGILLLTHPGKSLSPEELFIAEHVELLNDYDVINHLDLLEQWEVLQIMEDQS